MEIKTITIKDKKDGETKTVSYYMTDANIHIEDSYLIRSNETKKRNFNDNSFEYGFRL